MNKTRSIAFCGLITALHVIATILLRFEWIPGIELFILFLVPFLSAMISLKTDIRYSLIFSVASLLICGLIDYQSTLLYILPTISVGLAYGLCVKCKIDGTSIVYILTLLEFGLFFLSSYILKLISKIDIIETMEAILHFEGTNKALGLGFLFLYSFAQAFMVHIVTKYELKKMNINVVKTVSPSYFVIVVGLAAFISAFFNYEETAYSFFTALLGVACILPLALYGYQTTDKPYIILGVQTGLFLVGTLPLIKLNENLSFSYTNMPAYLILIIPPVAYGLYSIFFKKEK